MCQRDEQCSLAGEPGVCVSDGHCAYPDPACPSGLSYPQGAPYGLAGECVPPEAVTDTATSGSETVEASSSGTGVATDTGSSDDST
jgi:hypothetical protein